MRELTLEELELTTGLRELTLEELELTAGGYDTRYNDGGDGWNPIGDGAGDGVGDFGDHPDAGGGDDHGGGDDRGGDGGSGGDSGGGGTDTAPTDTNPPTVTGGFVNLHNATKVAEAVTKVQAQIDALTPKIEALPDGARIRMADGSEMTGAELKDLWNRIDFKITDAAFTTDRGGALDFGSGTSAINFNTVEGWGAWTGGLGFLLLHEVAHFSEMGQTVDTAMWNAHLAAGGTQANYDASSPYFQENEEFGNASALAMTATLEMELAGSFEPTNGYEYGDITR